MPDSQKRERTQLARLMRAQGKTWVEIAEFFRVRYRVNARVAFRYAHGWSQEQAAQRWCARWPDDHKTLKHFSYWEVWPASTGHAPSLVVLARLAELYECSVSDLLVDMPDYRGRDDAHRALVVAENQHPASAGRPAVLTGDIVSPKHADALFLDLLLVQPGAGQRATRPLALSSATPTLAEQLQAVNFDELAQVLVMWAQHWNPNIDRRDVLTKLSAAFTVAAAAPLFDVLDPDAQRHVARVLAEPAPAFDETALRYCEEMVNNLRRQDRVIGPRLTMQSVMGHRQIAERLARTAPAEFRHRAVTVYAEYSFLVGWLCFNLCDFDGGAHYYKDARAAAHDAQNVELESYLLCTMSQLATCRGRPGVGIDHAAAAAMWAGQTDSPHARAYAADVAVRAHLADNQPDKCRSALDLEYAALQSIEPDGPSSRWWDFYGESFYWGTYAEYALKFEKPDVTVAAIDKSLKLCDPLDLHERAHGSLFRAGARIQQDAVVDACTIIGDVAQLTAISQPERVNRRMGELRAALKPWERTKPVRDLDDLLKAYRAASSRTAVVYSA